MNRLSNWLVPDWPAPARVRGVFTTRDGGVSAPPFDSLNLGDHVGDCSDAVSGNRAILRAATGIRPVFLHQVHGTGAIALDTATPDAMVADACLTGVIGVACTIMVADCLPVLLTNPQGTLVAAAHVGWRGLAGLDGRGILDSVLERFCAFPSEKRSNIATKNKPVELMAWLGPCIGSAAFEVGPDVHEALCSANSQAGRCFTSLGGGKYQADLQALTRQRLLALGVRAIFGNDGSLPWCTARNPDRFFSHRRDGAVLGRTGRMAAMIWLDAG